MADKEYIEREAALKCICSGCFEGNMEKNGFCGIPCDDYKRISELPAADVRPVVRGKWIQTTKPMGWRDEECAECSVCGEDFVLDEWAMEDFTNMMNYCPNCGAMMEES